ncbi:Uu.00g060670.m01.CDS01 [Anthostomella pinea]|uniref:Uu.00g060670.m01.CDS01 n=1 Tax=Anthostomella pinea TaxID=933095 RepID=A0AAI8VTH0_9PEZI|nr:Uu.00g060670.m01.CDS01 [Anthostomella pinea]
MNLDDPIDTSVDDRVALYEPMDIDIGTDVGCSTETIMQMAMAIAVSAPAPTPFRTPQSMPQGQSKFP